MLSGYNCTRQIDLTGQIRSNTFIPGVAASPNWSGNITGSYLLGDLAVTLNARYVGGAYDEQGLVRQRGLRELQGRVRQLPERQHRQQLGQVVRAVQPERHRTT